MVKRGEIAVVTTLLFIGFVMLLLCGTSQGNGKATISEQKVIAYESPSEKIIKYTTIRFDVNEEFSTSDEADSYIEKCNSKNNCELSKEEKYTEWISNGTERITELDGLTEEERDKEVSKYKEETENLNTDTEKYVFMSENTTGSEDVFVEDALTEEDRVVFDDEKRANSYIEELNQNNTNDITYVTEGPVKGEEFVRTESTRFEETFKTNEERANFIKGLEDEGFTLSDVVETEEDTVVEKYVETGNIIVKSSSKLDKNNSYSVEGNYIMIKQASGNVAIWTLEELTETQKTSFKQSWLSGDYDGSINNDYNFYFIYGEGSHNLSYIGNQWDVYTISVSGNTINLTCNSSTISHLNYGTFEKETEKQEEKTTVYKVNGTKSIDIYKDIYTVSYKKYEKIYETIVTYGALLSKELFIREKYYSVIGYCEETKEEYIEKPITDEKTKLKSTNKTEIVPPYTGASSGNSNFLLDVLIIGAFAIYFPIKRELENLT